MNSLVYMGWWWKMNMNVNISLLLYTKYILAVSSSCGNGFRESLSLGSDFMSRGNYCIFETVEFCLLEE